MVVKSESVVAVNVVDYSVELKIGVKVVYDVTAAVEDVEITFSTVLETFSSVRFPVVPSVSTVDPKTLFVVIASTDGYWLLLEGIKDVD